MTTKSVASTCLLSKTKSSFFLLRAAGHPPIGNSRIWTYVPERIDSKIYTMDNYRDDIDDEMMMIMRWDNVISVKLHDHHPFQEWKGELWLVIDVSPRTPGYLVERDAVIPVSGAFFLPSCNPVYLIFLVIHIGPLRELSCVRSETCFRMVHFSLPRLVPLQELVSVDWAVAVVRPLAALASASSSCTTIPLFLGG